jgi:hypothetical protein
MDFKQRLAIQNSYKKKLLKLNPLITNKSGIYIFTREENGFKFAYIGQAKHLLERISNHFLGYQHIDLSLKSHKLYGKDNLTGWKVHTIECDEQELNDKEMQYIKFYADKGYQLRNKTSGSQGKGKFGIAENKAKLGYYDGIKQGKVNLLKDIKKLVTRLKFEPKDNSKISKRYYDRFLEIIGGTDDVRETNDT